MRYMSRFFASATAVLGLCLLASGCATSGSSGSSSPLLKGAKTQKLAYGISLAVPEGWQIISSKTESDLPKKDIDNTVASGGRVQLFEMKRVDGAGATTGAGFIFIVNSKQAMFAEEAVATATPEHFQQLAQQILKTNREEAAKQKRESDMLEWHASGTLTNGKTTLVQTGVGKGQEGVLRLLNLDIYLPDNVGVKVAFIVSEEPGANEFLQALMQGVQLTD